MEVLLLSLAALGAYMSVLFVVSLVFHNNGIADIGYGIAFMVAVGTAAALVESPTQYSLLLVALVFVWGARLAVRIFRKNVGKPEDFRYTAWRDAWGKTFVVRSFFQVYLLQGTVVFIVALPVLLALTHPRVTPFLSLFLTGVCVWLVGFFFESLGDYQLDRFLRNPDNRGKILTTGLWRYSRHPNYFGESCMWFGIALTAAGLTTLPIVGFVSPLLITFLLLKVSGVPLLEKRFESNPAWKEYKERTSVFVPLPQRRYQDS